MKPCMSRACRIEGGAKAEDAADEAMQMSSSWYMLQCNIVVTAPKRSEPGWIIRNNSACSSGFNATW
jgi:hypothetical protein